MLNLLLKKSSLLVPCQAVSVQWLYDFGFSKGRCLIRGAEPEAAALCNKTSGSSFPLEALFWGLNLTWEAVNIEGCSHICE